MTSSDIDRVAELCISLGCQFQLVAGEKRFVVSVISVCEILLLQGPCAYVEENGQEKLRWCISHAYPDVSLSLQLARGRLRFVTSHSRFALASLRSEARNEAPEEETADVLFGR